MPRKIEAEETKLEAVFGKFMCYCPAVDSMFSAAITEEDAAPGGPCREEAAQGSHGQVQLLLPCCEG